MNHPNKAVKESIAIILRRLQELSEFQWSTVFTVGEEMLRIRDAVESPDCGYEGTTAKKRFSAALKQEISNRDRDHDLKLNTLYLYRKIVEVYGHRKRQIIEAKPTFRSIRAAYNNPDPQAALDDILAGKQQPVVKKKRGRPSKAKQPVTKSHVWHVTMPTYTIDQVELTNRVTERIESKQFDALLNKSIKTLNGIGVKVEKTDLNKLVDDVCNILTNFEGEPAVLNQVVDLVNRQVFEVLKATVNSKESANAA